MNTGSVCVTCGTRLENNKACILCHRKHDQSPMSIVTVMSRDGDYYQYSLTTEDSIRVIRLAEVEGIWYEEWKKMLRTAEMQAEEIQKYKNLIADIDADLKFIESRDSVDTIRRSLRKLRTTIDKK